MIPHTRYCTREGFSMVVIAALFTAFSVIAAIAIDRNSITKQFDKQAQARTQLARLSNAILKYYVLNSNKYPCPARYDLSTGNASFGAEWNSGTNCVTGTSGGIIVLSGSTEVIEGMVPIAALTFYGADIGDGFDPWGNRIMYVVNRQLTQGGGTATTRPTVTDGITGRTINQPDFIVMSFGPDKLGAIPRDGTAITTSCAATTDARGENCDQDLNFIYRPSFTGPNATSTTSYDDIISFYAAQ